MAFLTTLILLNKVSLLKYNLKYMQIKDRVVSWFIQNIIMPRREIIDKPGFIITTFTEKNRYTYLRDLFLSEQLFECIENAIVENYGDEGKKSLYSAGKKFGYLYASLSNFPNIRTTTKKEFLDFAYILVRYVEGTFARKAKHRIDFDEKVFRISFKDYIICRNNGLGYIMTDGGIAGIWAYAMQNKSFEGVQLECQGRGNEECCVICGPEQKISSKIIFKERNLPDQIFDETYKKMNEIQETIYAHNSLKDLLDAGFFDYRHGILTYKKIRFFHCESHILYLIEQEISKLKDGEKTLFDACFEYGKFVVQNHGENDYQKFISDYYPALGFGDIAVIDPEKLRIAAIYFPWTRYSEGARYIIFRGIMSGIISGSLDKEVKFERFSTTMNPYTLVISE
jgi:hypothetical protein